VRRSKLRTRTHRRAFYSTLFDWPIVHGEAGTVIVKPPQDGVYMVFQLAEGYVAPIWPPSPGEQRT
jgi:hypothetical protein